MVKIQINITKEMDKALNHYRADNGMLPKTEAIVELVGLGLDHAQNCGNELPPEIKQVEELTEQDVN